jgi:single-stranded-DNA-specific exonuclease
LPGSTYPFQDLCGAGVAFKLAWQFCKVHCGTDKLPPDYRELLLDLLSLAALGTVADVVPLLGENRVIVTYGLGQIKRTKIAGINALIDASRLRDEKIDSFHIGFVLGPRLNACGRMGHAKQAVHLLTAAMAGEAVQIAEFLTQENDRRRATERAIFDEAKQMVMELGYDGDDCRAIVLGKEGWHPGVVGIVASRLVEAFARPVVMLNLDTSGGSGGGEAHGSARSVEGVSIHEAISSCSALLTTFGGHAMAAGLRLPIDRIDAFRDALVRFVNTKLGPDDLVSILDVDAECTLDDLSLELVDQVRKMAPFGRDNPTPILCVRGAVLERAAERMGQSGRHLSLMLRQGKRLMRAVAFGCGDLAERLPAGVIVDAAFEPHINEWQGVRRVELHVKDLKYSDK